MLKKLRLLFKKIGILRKFVAYQLAPSGLFDKAILNYPISSEWEKRIKEVLDCPDTEKIETVENAGCINRGKQIMHNGIKINLGSYYGPEYSKLLCKTKGIHEPQEEFVFQEILKKIPDGAIMIELGSFWSFYSMWFNLKVANAINIMIEPDSFNLGFGIRNFKLNKMKGEFLNAFVGARSISNGKQLEQVCVDDLMAARKIEHLNILHSDIQGYENEMLDGAQVALSQNKIDYFFISTHSNDVHNQCISKLKEHDYHIICEVDKDRTYSEDGLIVASSPRVPKEVIIISSKP
jgi:hypothetical protein